MAYNGQLAGDVAGSATSFLPQGRQQNNLQYTKMGASLFQVNPIAGALGTVIGAGADSVIGKQNAENDLKATKRGNEAFFQLNNQSPYVGGGFNQGMPQYKYGGGMLAGHVIPAENAGRAVRDAARVGVDIDKPVKMWGEAGGGIIPGDGGPKADDKTFQPHGGPPSKVSSGEAFVNDELFQRMATGMGMGIAAYQKHMYPKGTGAFHYAQGGPVKGGDDEMEGNYFIGEAQGLGYIPNETGHMPSRNWKTGHVLKTPAHPTFRMGIDEDKKLGYNGMIGPDGKVYTQSPDDLPQEGVFAPDRRADGGQLVNYADGGPYTGMLATQPSEGAPTADNADPNAPGFDYLQQLMKGNAGIDPAPGQHIDPINSIYHSPNQGSINPQLKTTAMDDDSGQKPGATKALEAGPGEPDMQASENKSNKTALGINLGAGATSLAWNLFSHRTPGIPPATFTPERLDLHTGALATKLDADRTRSLATAVYNSRDDQNVGKDLGLVANDLSARRDDSMVVEDVKNKEREFNTQQGTQANLLNWQAKNQFNQGEVEANDRFQMFKSEAVTQSVGALSDSVGNYLNQKTGIEDQGKLDRFQDRYLNYLMGANGTEHWTPGFVYSGQAKRLNRPNFGFQNIW